jgi:hypothetical protein
VVPSKVKVVVEYLQFVSLHACRAGQRSSTSFFKMELRRMMVNEYRQRENNSYLDDATLENCGVYQYCCWIAKAIVDNNYSGSVRSFQKMDAFATFIYLNSLDYVGRY